MSEILLDIVSRNRAGETAAIPSVCSAQPDVLRASLRWAQRKDRPIVIEATSNQVNQDGGYTGKTPIDFVNDIRAMATGNRIDQERIVLGGDHLGPQAWRNLPAEEAMKKAEVLVADYVTAGFGKIHLDCSEGCKGEPAQLPDETTADRTARLASVCENASTNQDILYVIGTEVPPPGGARVDESGDIPATTPEVAADTLAAHDRAFAAIGLDSIKARIAGLVVQPGVEFSPTQVHHMPPDRDPELAQVLGNWPNLCLEAHSTDYQKPEIFSRLAELGFAFQKVGPALTFAYRQALYSLDTALSISGQGVGLSDIMEDIMVSDPKYWTGHYEKENRTARHVGLADRIRYYWPHPKAAAAVNALRTQAGQSKLPDPLLWQVFAPEVLERAESLQGEQVQRLIDAQIELALDPYEIG